MKRPKPQPHWTESSIEDYKSLITFDLLDQLIDRMNLLPLNQAQLAERLGVGESAVSQILNNPTNLKLDTIIRYVRALGLKLSLVTYDDGDPGNTRGPISSRIFTECWMRQNKPVDSFDLAEAVTNATDYGFYYEDGLSQGGFEVPSDGTWTYIDTVDLDNRARHWVN